MAYVSLSLVGFGWMLSMRMVAVKESKHIVKVIKQEAKAERKALDIAVKELAGIQRMQKNSIKVRNASLAHLSRLS